MPQGLKENMKKMSKQIGNIGETKTTKKVQLKILEAKKII